MTRDPEELRDIDIRPGFIDGPAGSAMVSFGRTKVLCTVMVEERVPQWLMKDGEPLHGWVTSTYNMLPGSGNTRIQRERRGAKGRTQEIERLIGRSLRTAVDLHLLGGRTLWVDCDVLQADGGTRTAAITGAWVALKIAVSNLMRQGLLTKDPVTRQIAAVSVGIVGGKNQLDLAYREDSEAEVDMNVIMDSDGNLVEIQATGEEHVFSREQFLELLDLAEKGIGRILKVQESAVAGS
ncbi:MAG TPA: ribonuclease PH [Euryarchaeota archaeon]|nr:ribonuclease PH [Euryarchaeota archaeon]